MSKSNKVPDSASVEKHLANIKQLRLKYQRQHLIQKHLEGWQGLEKSSIEYYAKSGNVSGSLFVAIEKMMEEYREFKPTADHQET